MTGRVRIAALVAAGLVAFGGCGDSSAPADQVPQLADTLTAVDAAMSEQRYPAARRHLQRLVAQAEESRQAGDLEAAQADRVITAAARLLAKLPPAATANDEQQTEEAAKKLEEERKKLEEHRDDEGEGNGEGNGDSSEHGSDDDEDD